MTVPLDRAPRTARAAWTRLRDGLVAALGDDVIAMWAYGGTIAASEDAPLGDLDTFVVVRAPLDEAKVRAVEELRQTIETEAGVDFDVWFVAEEDARRPEMHRHAWRDRLNESWAIDRAHWLSGRYVLLHGAEPADLVPPPTRDELDQALRAEVEHLERHVEAGDTDPYEATYAFLNGCRVIRALETGDVVMSKREAGPWGIEHLPDRWHPALDAAMRAYDKRAADEDEALLAREMAPFVAMVRARLTSRIAVVRQRG